MRFARRPLPGTGPYRIARFDLRRGGRLVRNRHFRPWSQEARPDGFADEIAIDVGGKSTPSSPRYAAARPTW